MISLKYHCVFVKIPKTAGTSVAIALQCQSLGKPHRNIRELRDLIHAMPASADPEKGDPRRFYTDFYKFGFVRNPWSRVVSLYLRREGIQMRNRMSFEQFVNWIQNASDTCVHPSVHRNQRDWFLNAEGENAVDFVGKFENLDADFGHLATHLGAQHIQLPHKRKNQKYRKHYTEYFTAETREMVADKFSVDIKAFGYTFDGSLSLT